MQPTLAPPAQYLGKVVFNSYRWYLPTVVMAAAFNSIKVPEHPSILALLFFALTRRGICSLQVGRKRGKKHASATKIRAHRRLKNARSMSA